MPVTAKFGVCFYDELHNAEVVMDDDLLQNLELYYHKFEDKWAIVVDGFIEIVEENRPRDKIQIWDTLSWLMHKLVLDCIPYLFDKEKGCYAYNFFDAPQHLVLLHVYSDSIKLIDEIHDYALIAKNTELSQSFYHCGEKYITLLKRLEEETSYMKYDERELKDSFKAAQKLLQENGLL